MESMQLIYDEACRLLTHCLWFTAFRQLNQHGYSQISFARKASRDKIVARLLEDKSSGSVKLN